MECPKGCLAASDRSECGAVPRVLPGRPGPIVRMRMRRVLSEQGCQVVGQDDRPTATVGTARRRRPDIVVFDLDGASSHQLGRLVRACPETTVVPWRPGEQ